MATIDISPSSATLDAGDVITVTATLRDADGNELAAADYGLDWLPEAGWLEVLSAVDGQAEIRTHGGFGAASLAVELRATSGGVTSAPAVIVIVELVTAGDRLVADAAAVPHAALVTGMLNGSCQERAAYSFASTQPLGNLTAPCPSPASGEVAFFSSVTRMDLRDVNWTEEDNVVEFKDVGPPIVVPLAVWVAPSGDVDLEEWKTMVEDDLTLATTRMEERRVGISFALVDAIKVVPAERVQYVGSGCEKVYEVDATGPARQDYVDFALNVYYVSQLDGQKRGVTCWRRRSRPEEVILISVGNHVDVTLAHELGHALGLVTPHVGHVSGIEGFDRCNADEGLDKCNIMYDLLEDDEAKARYHFTLGQAYRMNVESESWLNRGFQTPGELPKLRSGPTRECACSPYVASPCPPLAADVDADVDTSEPWDENQCRDLVLLTGANNQDRGFVVLDGVRWRSRFACAQDLVGEPLRLSYLFGSFPNMSPDTDCPSRVTVFLEGHRMQQVELDAPWWDREKDTRVTPDLTTDETVAIPIPVHLWIEAGAAADAVAASGDHAKAVFADGSQSGVVLNVKEDAIQGWTTTDLDNLVASIGGSNAAGNCGTGFQPPAANLQTGSVNVYMLTARTPPLADYGHGCWHEATKTHFMVVEAGASSAALAHHLGHALGLSDVSAPDNLMESLDTPGGARTHLTLGQIYRLNMHSTSFLQRAGLRTGGVDCATVTDPSKRCIGLLVDVP